MTARGVILGSVIAAVLSLASIVTAAPASAHAQIVSSEPADGATLHAAPDRIVLRFSERIQVRDDAVRIFDSAGSVAFAPAALAEGTRDTVVADVPPLSDGVHAVSWRVTSADAEPITGQLSFTVGASRAPGAAGPDVDDLVAEPPSARGLSAVAAVLRFIGFGAMLLLVGVVTHVLVVSPRAAGAARAVRIVEWSAALLVLTGVAAFGVGAARAAGRGLSASADIGVWQPFLETTFGRASLMRTALAALALTVARRSGATTIFAVVGIVATFVATGHAVTGAMAPVATFAASVHLVAAGAWVGGLVALVALGGTRDERTSRRFSAVAAWSVAALVVTGSFAAWRQLGDLRALTSSDYGRILVVKLALVTTLLGVAAVSRRAVRRSLSARLRRSVAVETLVSVLVLVAATALVGSAPEPDATSPEPHTAEASGAADR